MRIIAERQPRKSLRAAPQCAYIHTMPSSREVLARLKADGWYEVRRRGTSHIQLKHPTKPGRATVPHPVKDLRPNTLASIEHQTGLKLRAGR
jgi:predicted RNA binding protein YcfA (HicA-like mRNA interferase family)